ncbi:T9SS type A sorting domain-containing protein [Pseudotamlana agarivorans]|uniref:T9SS type A sorting domain-containing protein n=1 Tax=Pseudotamlana agarivorans TaxID=481183 RepID=UPI00082994C3|nr:T9SS type A sorting domain-containing protein [Tamlana agarivorans]
MKNYYMLVLLLITSLANAQQITLVKDINYYFLGEANFQSSPANLTAFNGKLYFSADDSQATNTGGIDVGKELWVSDGTPEGTVLVKDLDGSSDSSNPEHFFELNNKLYFQAQDFAQNSYNFFTTDGTEAGTVSLGNNFQGGAPIVIGNKAYMRSFFLDANNNFLGIYYEFDGTTFQALPDSGTGEVKAGSSYIALDNNSILFNMTYTVAGTSVGQELYMYNITNQSYTLIKNFDDGPGDSNLYHFTKLGDDVYFEYDSDLWVTDGTTGGTTPIASASAINDIGEIYAWGGKLYFEGDDGNNDQLWAYDPATDKATSITDFAFRHDPVHFAAPGDGYLYYAGKSQALSATFRLYRTDGVAIEPIEIDLIDNIDDIAVLNHKLYFEASFNTSNEDPTLGNVDIGRELFTYTNDELNTLDTSAFEFNNSISIYPNPSTSFVNIKTTLEGQINYSIYDLLGKQVLGGTMNNNIINYNLTSGLYLLKLDNGLQSITKKIIVKN